jgi:hypothetical protein
MAHFAKIDKNNIVTEVIVIPNTQEHRGAEFINDDLGLEGNWIQTSYNGKIRKQFAGIGFSYNEEADVFIEYQPFESWTLDGNFDWQAPKPRPDGLAYWDEETLSWVDIPTE